jgi:hypothetical protein
MPGIVGDWLSSLERGTVVVRDAWRMAVAAWRRQARLAEPACDASFDSIDAVAAWMDGLHSAVDDGARNAPDIAALLDSRPPVGAAAGTVVFGHWSGTVDGATICRPGWAIEAEVAAGVTVAGVTPAGRHRGAAHAVFPDPQRPELRWPLLPGDASAPRSWPVAGAQRIVEAA